MQLKKYARLIREEGYKCTPQRMEILSYFLKQKYSLISAKDIYLHLRHTFGRISVDTVYRNLTLFKQIGLMNIIYKKGVNLYYLKKSEQKHQLLFICVKCLTSKELFLDTNHLIKDTIDGWNIQYHRLEVYGRFLSLTKLVKRDIAQLS